MDTNPFDIARILVKKRRMQFVSDDEEHILQLWFLKNTKNKEFYDQLLADEVFFEGSWLSQINRETAWEAVQHKRNRKKRRYLGWSVAASLALLMTISLARWISSEQDSNPRFVATTIEKHKNDILPANLGAKIILSDGSELHVEDTLSVVESQDLMHGVLDTNEELVAKPIFHTLVVPTANFFKLTLADGTTVWVNSHSELRFPSTFSSNERRVFLTGEAYFEVAKDASKPFYVQTEDAEIQVLGTHFNLASYGKNSKTSLAEGRVQMTVDDHSVVIAPGQSAQWTNGALKVKNTNLQKDLAWKNNEFYFKEDNIIQISQQLKLWYDLDVSLSKNVSLTETYTGEIRRDVRLSEVLTMLEFVSDLDFSLNKNKLLITKK